MPRVTYDSGTKDAIVKAVVGARKSEKTWKQAHEAAVAAGYKGSQQGIIKLMRTLNGAKRKPGRPKGKRRGRRPGTMSAARGGDIGGLIERLVNARIDDALDAAIAVLKNARD